MQTNKQKRRDKKSKSKQKDKKSKILKIRKSLRSQAKLEKETEILKKEVEKLQFSGTTIRKNNG